MNIAAATNPGTGASLAQRVIAYFSANPEEELSSADVVRKFDVVNGPAVHAELASAVSTGQLTRMTGGIYAAGPNLAAASAAVAEVAATTGRTKPARSPAPAAPLFDPESIVIEEGVDRPRFGGGFKAASLRSTLSRLFARMTPNSHAVLDLCYRASAQETLRQWKREHPEQSWGMKADPEVKTVTINRYA